MGEQSSSSAAPEGVKSCAGVTYFTAAMRKDGKAPYCFGRRGVIANENASPPEVIERSANGTDRCAPVHASPFKRVWRLAQVGMRFMMVRSLDKAKVASPADGSAAPLGPLAAPAAASSLVPADLGATVARVAKKTQVSVTRFWVKALENYPQKFQTFSKKLAGSMAKQATYVGNLAVKYSKVTIGWFAN